MMKACCEQLMEKSGRCCEKLGSVAPLLARLSVGWVMLESGWGKFQNMEKVVEFFGSLGIPAPGIQAPFVAGVELLGGVLLIIGLFTRLASVPLAITMVVAIITAKREELTSLSDLFSFSEYLYIVLLFWLMVAGPGKYSLDARCCKMEREKWAK